MRKLILLVHISLDGYVAGQNGDFDGFEPGDDNLKFVNKLTENADAALFGRKSFQLLEANWPTVKDRPDATIEQIAYSNWYNKAKKIVISTTIKIKDSNIHIISKDIPDEVTKLKKQTGKDILIFGSPTASQLLIQHDLIDSYWILMYPVIFGKGIPLFSKSSKESKLELIATKKLSNGELVLNYNPRI